MPFRTEKEAAEMKCPNARIFSEKKGANCDGSACIAWRWKPVNSADPRYVAAVKRTAHLLAQEDGEGKHHMSYHQQASKAVAADLEGHGVVATRGYCGLAGIPQ